MIKWNTVLHKKGSIKKIHKTLATPLRKMKKPPDLRCLKYFTFFNESMCAWDTAVLNHRVEKNFKRKFPWSFFTKLCAELGSLLFYQWPPIPWFLCLNLWSTITISQPQLSSSHIWTVFPIFLLPNILFTEDEVPFFFFFFEERLLLMIFTIIQLLRPIYINSHMAPLRF